MGGWVNKRREEGEEGEGRGGEKECAGAKIIRLTNPILTHLGIIALNNWRSYLYL